MLPLRRIVWFVTLCALLSPVARADNGAPADRQIERFLIDIPTAQGAMADSARLNEEPHYPGSRGDYDMAVWMRDRLREYGFNAEIEPVRALVPQLKRATLQLLVKPSVDFDLRESLDPLDPGGTQNTAALPFNAFSASGDVTAPVVYAYRGLEADYHTLEQANVPVQGRIVLIRYGAEFRGDLARRAQAHGAAGVLFYSDPKDRDGADNGPAFPNGPYRPLGSVQRGSLGTPALAIPVLPVSALTARRILQDASGVPPPPRAWRGGLDAGYGLGATADPVHLRVDESSSWITLWNTIGVLPGRDGSHSVMFGGHRDAWVYGVTDNGSGISTLLEMAHALGFAYRAGWRPAFSIAVAGWDGEEIGEAGSNSYVRTHYDSLSRGLIAYVNADENATGNFFYADGVAALAGVIPPVTRQVPDPRQLAQTVWERWRTQSGGVRVESPGGGSDHEPFLYLAGIPVLELGFAGPFGVYHSAYDNLAYANTQADPNFANHRALSQLMALMAFRMTSGSLPYDLPAYVAPMRQAFAQLSASNGTGADLKSLTRALDRFASVANAWTGSGVDDARTIEAVHRLDLLFYGRKGYAGVAFPKLSEAMAQGNAAAVQQAADQTAADLDAVSALMAG